ncbi:MAG: hypothetical protein ACK4ML_00930 [Alishewanella aestuarii]
MASRALTKQIKLELAKAAFNKLFRKQQEQLAWDMHDFGQMLTEQDPECVELMAEKSHLSDRLKSLIGVQNSNYCDRIILKSHTNEIAVAMPRLSLLDNDEVIGISLDPIKRVADESRNYNFLRIFMRGTYYFKTNRIEFRGDDLKPDKDLSTQFFGVAEQLIKRADKLRAEVDALNQLLLSVRTEKQLQDLSPDLYALLPSQTVRHTLMVPAEAVCTINELFKQQAA